MRPDTLLALLSAVAVEAIRIIQSNDDGWAELYLRSFNDALNAAGHDVVLSGPADNQSGRGELMTRCALSSRSGLDLSYAG